MPLSTVAVSRAVKLVSSDEETLARAGRDYRGDEVPYGPSLFSPNSTRRLVSASPGPSSEWFWGAAADVVVPESLGAGERLRLVFPLAQQSDVVVFGAVVRFQYHIAASDSTDQEETVVGDTDSIVVPLEVSVSSFDWTGVDSAATVGDPQIPSADATGSTVLELSRVVPNDAGLGDEGGELSAIVYTGSESTNDLVASGPYFGATEKTYVVKVRATGVPDTFVWSDDGGVTFSTTPVPMSTSDSQLGSGISVRWSATTGHSIGTTWTFTATPPINVSTSFAKRPDVMGGSFSVRTTREVSTQTSYSYRTYVTGIRVSERSSRSAELDARVRIVLAVKEDPTIVGIPTGNWRFVNASGGLIEVERQFLKTTTYAPRVTGSTKRTYHALGATIVPYVTGSSSTGLLANSLDAESFSDVIVDGEKYTAWGAVRYGGSSLSESAIAAYFKIPGTPRAPSAGTLGLLDKNVYKAIGTKDMVFTGLTANKPKRVTLYYPGVSDKGGTLEVEWIREVRAFSAVQLVYNPYAMLMGTDTGGAPSSTEEDQSYHHWVEKEAFVSLDDPLWLAHGTVAGGAAFGSVTLDVLPGTCASSGATTERLKLRVRSVELVTEERR